MKKVTAFVGSAHRKNTYNAVAQFLSDLQQQGDVSCEIVTLSDYKLGMCRGCQLCFEKGEAFCPLKDDRDVLFEKIAASDGVVFASPNYCGHVSGMMKVFIDRFGYSYHRPRYFGKAFTSIVTLAIGGGKPIVEYLDAVGKYLGFNTLKGSVVAGFDPKTEKEQQKIDRDLLEQSRRFYAILSKLAYPVPTIFQLMWFRVGRTLVKQQADPDSVDYRYYADRDWFKSDYFYSTQLSLVKKAAGKLLDSLTPTIRRVIA